MPVQPSQGYFLPTISEQGLREIIEEPARLARLDVKEVAALIRAEVGALPLVENARFTLWELQPFYDQVGRYDQLGMIKEEALYCMGAVLGRYRYERESESEFKQWSVDIAIDCAGDLLGQWRERGQDPAFASAMKEFVRDRCPSWGACLLRTAGRS